MFPSAFHFDLSQTSLICLDGRLCLRALQSKRDKARHSLLLFPKHHRVRIKACDTGRAPFSHHEEDLFVSGMDKKPERCTMQNTKGFASFFWLGDFTSFPSSPCLTHIHLVAGSYSVYRMKEKLRLRSQVEASQI